MPESKPSSETAPPSAETEKDRVAKLGEETNLGAGNEEPDPATAEDPPRRGGEGDEKRGGS